MSGNRNSPSIRVDRLRALLDGVNQFGRSEETGGFNRPAFSDADLEARRWFAEQMEQTGLHVRWDAAGNLFGRWGPDDGPVVMAGSHLDTVIEGGAFDGSLGVCVALECVCALKDAGIEPAFPVDIVATSDEEGRFGGMLGSQAICGQVAPQWIEQASDSDGVRLADAMAAQHLHAGAIPDAAWPKGAIRAFLELHIEQGPALKAEGKTVGIVDAVSGLSNWQVTLDGAANHSGTTPMSLRADAFAGLAEIAATIPSVIRIVGRDDTRITIGKVDLVPNHAHTIPGRAVFNLIIRDPDETVMKPVTAAMRSLIGRIAGKHKLAHSIDEMSWIAPARLDPELADQVEAEAERLGLDCMRMVSGAGHDAQTMQSVCPSVLIFVPSEDGVSHSPLERTEWSDIEKGAALYLATLQGLCSGTMRGAAGVTDEPAAKGESTSAAGSVAESRGRPEGAPATGSASAEAQPSDEQPREKEPAAPEAAKGEDQPEIDATPPAQQELEKPAAEASPEADKGAAPPDAEPATANAKSGGDPVSDKSVVAPEADKPTARDRSSDTAPEDDIDFDFDFDDLISDDRKN